MGNEKEMMFCHKVYQSDLNNWINGNISIACESRDYTPLFYKLFTGGIKPHQITIIDDMGDD